MDLDGKTDKDTFERSTIICPRATTTASAPASHQEKKATQHLGHPIPWIIQRQEKGCNLMDDNIHTDIPGYQNFVRIPPAFLTSSRNAFNTNFKKPLDNGQKLAITLRHQATRDTYTSLQYHWLFDCTTICKFVLQVCRAILMEFQDKYLHCPDSPRVEKFSNG